MSSGGGLWSDAGRGAAVFAGDRRKVTPVANETDFEALMRQSLIGDRSAYAELLRQSARLLRPFLERRLQDRSSIDDLLQEILISLHKARHTYDGNRPYKPWLYAIARFRLKDHLRALYADRLADADDWQELEALSAPDVTESLFEYESLHREIGRLPEKQAEILRLMYREGFTARETAEQLGMSESAVKVAAHRAYKKLRERMEP